MGELSGCESVVTRPALLEKRRRRPSVRAFEMFRAVVVEREVEASVAKRYGISQQRVSFLVLRVTRWAKEHEGQLDPLAIKVQHTSILYDLYREAREQWKRSCADAETHSVVSVTGKVSAAGVALPEQKTTRVETRGQTGNPSLMKCMDDLLASIRGIWGADAPKQFQGTVDGKSTLAVILARAERSLPPPSEETGNVIDVDSELEKLRSAEARNGHG